MKKIITFLAVILCAGVYAQDWTQMMKSGHASLKDVQKAFYQWQAAHQSSNKEERDRASSSTEETDGNYELFKRWEWAMMHRTDMSGNVPDWNAISQQYQNFLASQASSNRTSRVLSATKWSYIGPTSPPNGGGGAGRVNRIRIHPTNNNILFACTPSGGLWESTNGGASWFTKTDHLYDLAADDIAIDPTNTNIMYLGTGDGDGISGGFTTPSTVGVLKSTDGGNTWAATNFQYSYQSSGPSEMTVNELLISPADHNFIFAATSFGLYYSPNAGITWNLIMGGDIKDMAFEPTNPQNMYVSTAGSPAKFYRSTDGGLSFTLVTLPWPAGHTPGRIALAVTPADPNRVYALADDNSTYAFLGLCMSTNQGQSFTLQSSSPNLLGFSLNGSDNVGQGWYTLSLAASQTSASTIIVGGVNIWMSTNSGVSWTLNADQVGVFAPYVHADIHNLTYLPGSGSTYYASCDGGIFKTTNSGPNFSDISHNLEIAQQYCLGLSANTPSIWLSGWQDNGTNLYNAGWLESLHGDGMDCFIDRTNNNIMYGETYNGGFNISTNGGGSWSGIAINTSETGAWVTPWQQDPSNASTIYGAYENVWKSTNKGSSWSKISTWGVTGISVVALAVAPSNNQYIYAASNNGFYATTNGGTSWTNVSGSLPLGYITGIAVDNTHPNRVWASFAGYTSGAKVYESDDGGTTWNNISGLLPNLPVNCIAYQGAGIDAMYVGTDMGVFYRDTTNTQKNWIAYNNGLPNVEVADLKIYAPGNLLTAGTYGRGTWQISTYGAPAAPPVVSFSAFPLRVCVNNSVQFIDSSSNLPTTWNWTFTGGNPSASISQNPIVTYSTPGLYQVKLRASNGSGSDSLTKISYIRIDSLPSVAPVAQQIGDLMQCNPHYYKYYQWYCNNALIPYDTTYKFWMWQTGFYKVVAYDSEGCSRTSAQIHVSVLGVNEISNEDGINVYPNPASGTLNLSLNIPQEGDYTLNMNNVLGQTVYTDEMHLGGPTNKSINISNFSKGIYMLTLNGQNIKIIKKVIVY